MGLEKWLELPFFGSMRNLNRIRTPKFINLRELNYPNFLMCRGFSVLIFRFCSNLLVKVLSLWERRKKVPGGGGGGWRRRTEEAPARWYEIQLIMLFNGGQFWSYSQKNYGIGSVIRKAQNKLNPNYKTI